MTSAVDSEHDLDIPGFQIRRVLVKGKVAVVYDAYQDNPGRPVALKVFKSTTDDDKKIKRFFQEADILLRLQHPGLAKLLQTGMCMTSEGKHHYHVFEPIEGIPITSHAELCGLDTRARLGVFLRVCDIVSYVHEQGILHRNLKPENILVTQDGQPKLIDFGLARLVIGAPKLTTRGNIVGNLTYLSPEQTSGNSEDLDARMDLYALGGIGYTLLAGHPPFDFKGKNLGQALSVILNEVPVKLGAFNPMFKGDLERVFARTLEKDKNARHESVAAFASDLREHLVIAGLIEQ